MVMGARFEIIVEVLGLHDAEVGIREVSVTGSVTLTLGGGPER